MAFCAGTRIGIEPSSAIDPEICWMGIDAGMTRDAVVLGMAARTVNNIAPRHHPMVVGRPCIDKPRRVKRDP